MPYTAPNYGPTTDKGDTRRRIWRVTCENPLNGIPSATMHEEDVVRVANGEVSFNDHPAAPLHHVPTDPSEIVEIRNIADDTLLGTTTLGQIHTLIYSLGRHLQKLRDISEVARIAAEEAAAAQGQ